MRLIGDWEPGASTSTFTQFLISVNGHVQVQVQCCFSSVLLYVHRDRNDYSGRGARDGHLDFHRDT